jgi:hypothetical protein
LVPVRLNPLTLPVKGLVIPTGIVDAALIPWPLIPAGLTRSPLIRSALIRSALIRSPLIRSALITVPAVVVALAVLYPARPGVSGRRADSDSQREGGQPEHTGHHGPCRDFLQIHRVHLESFLARLFATQWRRKSTLTCSLKDLTRRSIWTATPSRDPLTRVG